MKKLGISFLFYLCFFLYIADLVVAIGVDPKSMQRAYLLNVPLSDLSLGILLIVFFIKIQFFAKVISARKLFMISIFGFIYFIYGLSRVGVASFNHLNFDIRVYLWFFGGLSLGYLLLKTGKVKYHLSRIIVIASFIIAISSIMAKDYFIEMGLNTERITHPNIYIGSGLLFTPLIIYIYIAIKELKERIFILVVIALYTYFVAIESATRSSFIITLIILYIFFVAFNIYKIISKREQYSVKVGAKLLAGGAIVCILVPFMLFTDSYFVSRFTDMFNFSIIAGDSRAFELLNFFEQGTYSEFILGKGFGGSIDSFIYNFERTEVMHIGIMNFWLKYGFIPFLGVVYILYFWLPYRFFNNYKRIKRHSFTVNNYLQLVFISSLLPWIFSLLMSGGFSDGNFMMVGIVYFMYSFSIKYGPSILLKHDAPFSKALLKNNTKHNDQHI